MYMYNSIALFYIGNNCLRDKNGFYSPYYYQLGMGSVKSVRSTNVIYLQEELTLFFLIYNDFI